MFQGYCPLRTTLRPSARSGPADTYRGKLVGPGKLTRSVSIEPGIIVRRYFSHVQWSGFPTRADTPWLVIFGTSKPSILYFVTLRRRSNILLLEIKFLHGELIELLLGSRNSSY